MSREYVEVAVEPADTVVSIRERLQGLRGGPVLLVWRTGGGKWRKLDLVLLQREAYRRAIQLAIVSQDAGLRAYAADLNISCFPSIEASQVQRWKRGRNKVFLPRHHKPNMGMPIPDMALMRSRRKSRPAWRIIAERLLALALLIAAIGAALYMVVPGALVTISLQEQDISLVMDILADENATSVDVEKGILPAEIIRRTVETSATLAASGRIRLDSVSSAAVVTFTNLGDERVDIARGTIISTSAGAPILFETVADVVVPAGTGQHADAVVKAMDSYRGSIGNVGPGMINTLFGELADRVSALNLSSASGGSSRSVRSVAAADQERLLELLRIQLQSLAYEQMRAELSDTQVIVIESLGIEEERKEWTEFSAEVGTMTSQLSLIMRAVVRAQAIDRRYIRQLLLARLHDALPDDMNLEAATLSFTRGAFSPTKRQGQTSFPVAGSVRAIARLDVDALRERLAGLTINEAYETLAQLPAVSSERLPRIETYPSSWQRMPQLAVRIETRLANDA